MVVVPIGHDLPRCNVVKVSRDLLGRFVDGQAGLQLGGRRSPEIGRTGRCFYGGPYVGFAM